MAAPIVILDPNTPVGTEPLKLGPLRFQEIKSSLLREVQLPDGVFGQFTAPFSFDLVNDPAAQTAGRLSVLDPIAPGEIATARYADAKVPYGAVTNLNLATPDGLNYIGTVTPLITAPQPGQLFVVANNGIINTGGVMLNLVGAIGLPLPLLDVAGLPLTAGDFVTGSTYLVMVAADSSHYIMVGVTKGYVDAAAGAVVSPSITPESRVLADTPILSSATELVAPLVFTTPSDAAYLLFVEYAIQVWYYNNAGGSPEVDLKAWVVDESVPVNWWASTGWGEKVTEPGITIGAPGDVGVTVLRASGFSPVSYPPSTPMNLHLRGTKNGGGAPGATATAGAGAPFDGLHPYSYFRVSLIRSH